MMIRTEQMATLSTAATDAFELDVLAHLKRCFPAECAQAGDASMREAIRYGWERARRYGITSSREVCTFIDVMMVFGRDFDIDPGRPWASAILNGVELEDTTAKVDELFQTAKKYYRQGSSQPA